jgi:hypothetical protein
LGRDTGTGKIREKLGQTNGEGREDHMRQERERDSKGTNGKGKT